VTFGFYGLTPTCFIVCLSVNCTKSFPCASLIQISLFPLRVEHEANDSLNELVCVRLIL